MTEMKIKLVEDIIKKRRKVNEVADILDVSRQSVSTWVARYRVEGPAGLVPKKSGPQSGTTHNRTSPIREDEVIAVAKDYPFKGPAWIVDQMPFRIHPATVYRILKRRGVRYYYDYKHQRRKKKRYCLDRPGREIQLDVCFPFGYERKEVVYDAIDDCSRFLFASVMSAHTQQATIAFLQEMIKRVPFRIEAVRTDQGREFGKEVTAFLAEHEIEHRRNPPYTPQHNGKVERYHRTFQEEEACYWNSHASVDELSYQLRLWMDHYNYHKKHTGLGMNKLTPAQKIIYATIQNSYTQNVNLILQQ
jgi:transposase InsO family protein